MNSDSTVDLLRDAAAGFLAERAGSARLRGWIARPRPVERVLWREAAGLGWTGLLLPESLGGSGLTLTEAAALCEEAGRRLFAEPLVAAAVMPALLLEGAVSGPEATLAAELAGTLAGGDRLLTLAWQEVPAELELPQPRCTWRHGRLSGVKRFVPACEPDATLLVWATAQGEPVWVVADASADGLQRSVAAAGLSQQVDLCFERVPGRVLLRGDSAARAFARVLCGGRLALAAELAGLARGGLEHTLDHLRTRRQFDRALGSFQSLQHRCVDLHIELELAAASVRHALALWEGQGGAAALDAAACAAKARAGEAAVRTGREAVQLHGAMGFCDEVDVGFYLRAALHGNAWLGSPAALRRRFAERQPERSDA